MQKERKLWQWHMLEFLNFVLGAEPFHFPYSLSGLSLYFLELGLPVKAGWFRRKEAFKQHCPSSFLKCALTQQQNATILTELEELPKNWQLKPHPTNPQKFPSLIFSLSSSASLLLPV